VWTKRGVGHGLRICPVAYQWSDLRKKYTGRTDCGKSLNVTENEKNAQRALRQIVQR